MNFFPQEELFARCAPDVEASTMKAIVNVESANQDHAIGYLIRDQKGNRLHLVNQPKNKAEAKEWAKWLLDNHYRFDSGRAQINSSNFEKYGLTINTVFEPCANLKAASQILSDCYNRALKQEKEEQRALRKAIACYQSGSFSGGYNSSYIQKVVKKAIEYKKVEEKITR